jgi:CRP-like cAMP-binding protein
MDLHTMRQRLSAVPVLQTLPSDIHMRACIALWWRGELRELTEGEVLYMQEDTDANTGCVLLEGTVAITRDNRDPIDVKAPEILGELMQFDEEAARTATVMATEPSVVLTFSWHDFVILCGQLLDRDDQVLLKQRLTEMAYKRTLELKGKRK